jgi:ribosomal subunit interface protein
LDIRITGQHMKTGEALQERVRARFASMTEKYNSRALSATVVFTKAPQGMVECRIVSHLMHDGEFRSSGIASLAENAFEDAAEKTAKQWRRQMRKVKDHSAVPITEADAFSTDE